MAWQKGPLPPGSYGWGGVVTKECEGSGFFFADFHGDHVHLCGCDCTEIVKPEDVIYFDNSITLPPCCTHQHATRQVRGGAT